jgi:hypothetical protein
MSLPSLPAWMILSYFLSDKSCSLAPSTVVARRHHRRSHRGRPSVVVSSDVRDRVKSAKETGGELMVTKWLRRPHKRHARARVRSTGNRERRCRRTRPTLLDGLLDTADDVVAPNCPLERELTLLARRSPSGAMHNLRSKLSADVECNGGEVRYRQIADAYCHQEVRALKRSCPSGENEM